MSLIHIENLIKHFKILNRRPGLGGAFRDLLSGDYRTVRAVDGISFDLEAGEIVGYIGPNGAGKSTTIKMMTGILKPTGGTITEEVSPLIYFSPIIGIGLFTLTYRVWTKGVNSYSGTGS